MFKYKGLKLFFSAGKLSRRRVLWICLGISIFFHLIFLVSISPVWLGEDRKIKPKKTRMLSLRIKPRPAPPALAPRPPETVEKEEVKKTVKKPVYTKEELDDKLARVRSPQSFRRQEIARGVRVEKVIAEKKSQTQEWVDQRYQQFDDLSREMASGEIGYSRVIDLRESSSYQVSKLLEHYGIAFKFGRRAAKDINVKFTTEWLYRPGQIIDYLRRRSNLDKGRIISSIAPGDSFVKLSESGQGEEKPYIIPTIEAVAAVVKAEDEYFAANQVAAEELESLIFTPTWSFSGPAFTVTSVKKKTEQAKPQPTERKKEES